MSGLDLKSLPDGVAVPRYDRTRLKPRLVHIGFGAFARAHVLDYLDRTLDETGGDWGAVAVRLRSGADELADFADRGCLYTHVARDGEADQCRVNGSVIATAHPAGAGTGGAASVIDAIADPDVAIVTLTITEKGYCSRNGRLDTSHPDIAADLKTPSAATSAIGTLVRGLSRRRAAGGAGLAARLAIVSCDNLSHNGHLCRAVVTDFAGLAEPGLERWIADHVTFPSTMVDRITPAMQDEDYRHVATLLGGQDDPHAVVTEPFTQWVIEDDFPAGRPEFDRAGAQLVRDAAPFETMKLRMLNGAHSTLAYLGPTVGHETVADCMGDAGLRRAVRRLMLAEAAPTLTVDADLAAYADALLDRFANRALHHRLVQIAMDGSQKLPPRLLLPWADNLAAGRPAPVTRLAIAAWMRHVANAQSRDMRLDDPMADRLSDRLQGVDPATPAVVDALLAEDDVIPADLVARNAVGEDLRRAYAALVADPRAAIDHAAGDDG